MHLEAVEVESITFFYTMPAHTQRHSWPQNATVAQGRESL